MNGFPTNPDLALALLALPPEHPLNIMIAAEAEKIYLGPSDFTPHSASKDMNGYCLQSGSLHQGLSSPAATPQPLSQIRELMGSPIVPVASDDNIRIEVQPPLMQYSPLQPPSLVRSGSSSGESEVTPLSTQLKPQLWSSLVEFGAVSPQYFLDERVLQITCGLYGFEKAQETVNVSICRNDITFAQAIGLFHIIHSWRSYFYRELVTIHRQRKIIEEEMSESIHHGNTEDVYREVLTGKFLRTLPYLRTTGALDHQATHVRLAGQYYRATRITSVGDEELYCHLLGWAKPSLVVACRLVPEVLSQDLLAYLFGVGEVPVDDPRNAITLDVNLARALNLGIIAIVPYPSSDNGYVWTVVVVDHAVDNDFIYPGLLWKDMHRQPLKFQSDRRPSTRYLYFRYMITYLLHKRRLEPIYAINQGVKTDNKQWPISGPFLRRSMLIKLAAEIGKVSLPATSYEHTTFDDDDLRGKGNKHVQNWTSEEEDVLVLKLATELLDGEL
ncbi:hypothetical protein FQN49_001400 [Arthroderma sp. PD_2]|nr:hypothetical protein FQN49_001400 [Arthroderma sp. PD_2]